MTYNHTLITYSVQCTRVNIPTLQYPQSRCQYLYVNFSDLTLACVNTFVRTFWANFSTISAHWAMAKHARSLQSSIVNPKQKKLKSFFCCWPLKTWTLAWNTRTWSLMLGQWASLLQRWFMYKYTFVGVLLARYHYIANGTFFTAIFIIPLLSHPHKTKFSIYTARFFHQISTN